MCIHMILPGTNRRPGRERPPFLAPAPAPTRKYEHSLGKRIMATPTRDRRDAVSPILLSPGHLRELDVTSSHPLGLRLRSQARGPLHADIINAARRPGGERYDCVDRDDVGDIKEVARRLAGFTGWPLLALITPLVVSPLIARIAGDGWSTVVTAMSIGSLGMAAITWGWSLTGPPRVAQASESARWELYRESIHTRLLLSVAVLPLAGVLTALLAVPHLRLSAALVAIAFSAVGLLPQWYCIGIGKPTLLGLFDTLPRVIATLVALPIMLWTRSILAYPVLLLAGIAFSVWLFPRHVFSKRPTPPRNLRATWREITSMAPAAGTSLIGVGYSYAPVPIATALLAAAASSRFASADQLFRYSLYAVTALGNALQGWSLEVEGEAGRRRQIWAAMLGLILGVVGGIALAVAGPWVTGIMFGQLVAADSSPSLWYGIAFFFLAVSSPLQRNLLLPNGRTKMVLVATAIAALVGISVMFLAGCNGIAAGIAAGMAGSECLILIITARPALRVLNSRYPAITE